MTKPSRRVLRCGLVVVLLLEGMVVVVLRALQRQLIFVPDNAPVPPAGDVIPGATATARPATMRNPGTNEHDHGDDRAGCFAEATAKARTRP